MVLFAAKSLFSPKKTVTDQTVDKQKVKTVLSTAEPALEKHEASDFEFKLAANWFAIVGIIAIVFAVVFFLKYAFDNLNLHKVTSSASEDNLASIKSNQKAGLIVEATLKEQKYENGVYKDIILLGITKKEYIRAHRARRRKTK